MNTQAHVYYFAQAYGENAYGSCTYSASTSCSTSGGTGSGSAGSGLVNTGTAVAVIVTLACFIIFVAMVVRFWKRAPKQGSEVESVKADDDIDSTDEPDSDNNQPPLQ